VGLLHDCALRLCVKASKRAVHYADASCRLLQGQPHCKADKPHQHQSPREG